MKPHPLLLLLPIGALAGACDPVHDDAVSALGAEAPGVRKGPLHRPGQPCRACHDGALGDPPEFSVAGTVFATPDALTPASGATVALLSQGATVSFTTTTNEAGNFYVQPSQYTPSYPMHVSVTYNGATVVMVSHVGRDGSCADCHTDPRGPASAGHIYAVAPDGGPP
jgi:hypothetical protein